MTLEDLNKSIEEEDLTRTLSRTELEKKGFSPEIIEALGKDRFQNHSERVEGFLGSLIINYLGRVSGNGLASGRMVPAVTFASAINLDLTDLVTVRDGVREVVVERTIDNEPDLYISVGDLHLVNDRGDETESLTALATRYSRTKNPKILAKIAEGGMTLVRETAGRMVRKMGGQVAFEDLVADGSFGLIEAAENYDPTRGAKFETHANLRIIGAMWDATRKFDFISRSYRSWLKELGEFANDFRSTKRREPSYKDYEQEWARLGHSPRKFDEFHQFMENYKEPISLSQKIGRHGTRERDSTIGDLISGPKLSQPEEAMAQKELLQAVETDLTVLPAKHRSAVRAYMLEGRTMAEAGEVGGFSESRFSQICREYLGCQDYFRRTREHLGIEGEIRLNLS